MNKSHALFFVSEVLVLSTILSIGLLDLKKKKNLIAFGFDFCFLLNTGHLSENEN